MLPHPNPTILSNTRASKGGKPSVRTRAWSSCIVSGGLMDDLLLPRSRLWRLSRPTAHIFPTKRVGVGACKSIIYVVVRQDLRRGHTIGTRNCTLTLYVRTGNKCQRFSVPSGAFRRFLSSSAVEADGDGDRGGRTTTSGFPDACDTRRD